ncbi:phage portal protein [Neomegalonema sp.]|uniref:phage portal protein n=1 Tax=Neomegalonema sp. TaxID=2039713 RepID=UPI002604C66C|nr:phage portal protein [Neomegalonema sp.]MDD2870332.1 phage portal protein [Neomegalonema sp.]
MSVFDRMKAAARVLVGPSAEASGTARPAGWLDLGWGRASLSGLPRVDERAALAHGTVYTCVNVIAQDLAKVPLILYRRLPKGGKARVSDHPAARLMAQGDAAYGVPASVIRYGLQWALGLRGNAFAWIRRNGRGEVIGLDPIHNDRITLLKNGRERFYEFEDGAGVQRRVSWRDLLHLRSGAEDGWTGRSPIEMAADTLAVALGAQSFAGRHITGRGVIRGVVEHPDWFQDDEDAERFALRIRKTLDDPEANGIPILPYGMSYKSVGMSPADAQLLEQRRFDREQIAGVYRVPPAKAGIFEHGLRANVEQQAIDYVTDCLLGWARLNEDHFNLYLLTEEERADLHFEYLFDGLMRATTRDRTESLLRATGGPFLTRNEARALENRAPIPGADDLLPPSNMAALPGQEDDDEEA